MEIDYKSSWRQGEMMTKGSKIVSTAENDFSRGKAIVLVITKRLGASSDGVGSIRTTRLEICRRCQVFFGTRAAALQKIQDILKASTIGYMRMVGQPRKGETGLRTMAS